MEKACQKVIYNIAYQRFKCAFIFNSQASKAVFRYNEQGRKHEEVYMVQRGLLRRRGPFRFSKPATCTM